jgi:hypothetical protein
MRSLFVLDGSTFNRGWESILLSIYELLLSALTCPECINSTFQDDRVGRSGF